MIVALYTQSTLSTVVLPLPYMARLLLIARSSELKCKCLSHTFKKKIQRQNFCTLSPDIVSAIRRRVLINLTAASARARNSMLTQRVSPRKPRGRLTMFPMI